MLTNEQLNAIRERAERATCGQTPEWYVDEEYKDTVRCAWSADLIAQSIPTTADAEFIAHAREDVPMLLAEIERLHSKLSSARQAIGNLNVRPLGRFIDSDYVSVRADDLLRISRDLMEAIANDRP